MVSGGKGWIDASDSALILTPATPPSLLCRLQREAEARQQAADEAAKAADDAAQLEEAKWAAEAKAKADKEARKARRKEGKKRWKMGVMATLLDDADSDYDDIDEWIVDGIPLPEQRWDSDDSVEGLFDDTDPRARRYQVRQPSACSVACTRTYSLPRCTRWVTKSRASTN